MTKTLLVAMALATLLSFSVDASATTVTVLTNDYGWYDDSGLHYKWNSDYVSGNLLGPQYNDFFVFHQDVGGTLLAASFRVYSYGISVPGTYTMYGTNLDNTVVNSCVGCVATFNALTSGPVIGSITVTPADFDSWLIIGLNNDGLSWLESRTGLWAVIGGSFPQPDNGGINYIFGGSGPWLQNELIVTNSATPEPGTIQMLGVGIFALAGVLRRKVML